MVYYDLFLKVDGDNVFSIHLPGTNYEWAISVKCSCDEVHNCNFTAEDEIESDKGKGNFNFYKKCKECKSHISLTFYEKSRGWIKCNNGFELFANFDCRGCTPIDWIPSNGFLIKTESETIFDNVELNEDWCEYDEKSQQSCLITGYESKFERNKIIDK